MNYPVILADPPWEYDSTWGKAIGTRAAVSYYPVMDTAAISQIQVPAADNAALFLWATWPKMADALQVIAAWGFEYKTIAWVWVKLNRNSMGLFHGMGFYTRSNTEPCLLAVRGKMPVLEHDVQSVIMTPVQEHSRKPDDQYRKIERLYNGPYLEMFARRRWDGWDAWGNEIVSDISMSTVPA